MTATRIVDRVRSGLAPPKLAWIATLLGLAALWALAASLLWRTQVPADLDVSHLDLGRYFSAGELARTARFERFLRVDWVLATLASLAALVVLARLGPRLARTIGLGRVNTGIVLGMLVLTTLWFVHLPFAVAARWWEDRHGLTRGGYLDWLVQPWAELLGGVLGALILIAIVLALAGRFPRGWWLAAAPAFTAVVLLFALVLPWVQTIGTDRLESPRLRATAQRLERTEGVEGTPIRVQHVSSTTTVANAFTEGIGPSERVFLWNTLLDGRFSPPEVGVVVAHELGHVARRHIWKGIAWFGLFALPFGLAAAVVTVRRGGLRDPALVPLAMLVLAALGIASAPLQNAISRRYEAEADWTALQATRDPAAARGLFRRFSSTSLQQPNPPGWDYVMLENHPTIAQRIAMANAWAARAGP